MDSGVGGIQGPLLHDGSFEYLPIPDGLGVDERTYSNTVGRHGRRLVDYFPPAARVRMAGRPIHLDPEFTTFTYGDPTRPKASLRHLRPGDLLVFYCGLEGWGCAAAPALYLMGYFEVLVAGLADNFGSGELRDLFGANFHVRHPGVFREQRDRLVLVKGSPQSRLLEKAVLLSATGRDRTGKPLKVLSPAMQEVFGDFGGRLSLQRSPPRRVDPAFVPTAAAFVRSLR
jgi:hypothetical protein